uniref:non-specific serine/threonine protein kinase n=1 Tax=Quercus lobata TaxID=97700 RepID=A0A7N2LEI7_QUELO
MGKHMSLPKQLVQLGPKFPIYSPIDPNGTLHGGGAANAFLEVENFHFILILFTFIYLLYWSVRPPKQETPSAVLVSVLLKKNEGFSLLFTSVVSGNNETDWLVLLEFKAKIAHDPFGVLSSWNDSIHFCQWQRVICGHRHQRVTMLYLQSLKLGNIPLSLSKCQNLFDLNLANNNLNGSLSPQIIGLSFSLTFLDLSANRFMVILPMEVGNWINLEELDVSENMLFGKIPVSLGSCVKLELLAMRGNLFQGIIPPSLESLRGLEKLDLSNNNLSGHIPKFLEIFIYLQVLNLSYNQFEGEVPTNGVFKNTSATFIKGNGRQTIAVKVLNLLRCGASKSFIAESKALRNIRHRNLVKVLTSCSSVDHQGHDFKALVYEFMENGNLDEWLHPTSRTNETPKKLKNLSFLQRLNIAIDFANALDYLHHHCQTPIVHCDLKSSNILLDHEMIGHVGDFGLARFLFDATQDCSINQSISIGIRATVGYTPPKYGMGNMISTYGDVYSYEILLSEMFTGKRPTNDIFQDNLNLCNFVKVALLEQIIDDIIDPILLRGREGETQMNNITCNERQNGSVRIQECVVLIFEIGVACSVEFPRERMNMSAVMIELHSIRQKLLGTNIRRQRLQSTGAQES